jgi:amino acid transporter
MVFLYCLVTGLIVCVIGATAWYELTVADTYARIRDSVPEPPVAFLLGLAQAESSDLRKGGFQGGCLVLVLLGALLVIRKNVVGSFRLSVQHAQARSELRTSSPGLVLVALGLGVPVAMSYTPSQVKLQIESSPSKESIDMRGSTSSSQVPYALAQDAAPSSWLSPSINAMGSTSSYHFLGSTSSSQVPYALARDAAPSPWLSLLPERHAAPPYNLLWLGWMLRDQEPTTPAPGSENTPSDRAP